jgi:hypothetical protein
MSATVRFPFNHSIPNVGPPERSQIIRIASSLTSLKLGGEQDYTSIRPLWIAGENREAPYTCIVVEFRAEAGVGTIGNGTTDLVGLYGEIDLVETPTNATERNRALLGIIGINLGNNAPQIPMVQQAGPASDRVGFSQVFTNIACYDRLSVGGVLADITLPEGLQISINVRPIRHKDYNG